MRYQFNLLCVCIVALATAAPLLALPPGFTNEQVVGGLAQPIAFTFLPDGRVVILQKTGEMLIGDPSAIPMTVTPYMTISDLDTFGERGLIDITLHPDFQSNGYFYLYYARATTSRFQISRFTHVGDTADIASEEVIWIDNEDLVSCCHYGGSLDFGPDGRLYLTTGEGFDGLQSQDLSRAGGKIIRLNADGSIPSDNPFIDGPGGNLDEVWAYGLRNPFRASWDLPSGRFLIGEVGGNDQPLAREDIHLGHAGANYGWPFCEGECDNPDFPHCDCSIHESPVFSYPHLGSKASVMGGFIYRGAQFPVELNEAYFYGDYTDGWIRYLTFDDTGLEVTGSYEFEPNAGSLVDLSQGPDGSLFYVNLINGTLRRIVYAGGNLAPTIVSVDASPSAGGTPLTVQFTASATDPESDPLAFRWFFGDGSEADGAVVSHTFSADGLYPAYVRISDPTHAVNSDPIEIRVGNPPTAQILSPVNGTTFKFGDTISFEGLGTDPDETLSGANYSWKIDFVRPQVHHPALGPVNGQSVDFEIPIQGQGFSGPVYYECTLTVTDSSGLVSTDMIGVYPEKVDLTFDTNPSGIPVVVDGNTARVTPFVLDTLIGFNHIISVPSESCVDNTVYAFDSWDDGGALRHTITVPDAPASYTAVFNPVGECGFPVVDGLVMLLRADDLPGEHGSPVTNWVDRSSSGNNLSARYGAPTLLRDELNGHAAISFDGIDDAMGRLGFLGLPTGSADRTVFMLVRYGSDGWGGLAWGARTCNGVFGLAVSPDGNFGVQGWCSNSDQPSSIPAIGAGWLVQSVVCGDGAFRHYLNGALIDQKDHKFATGAESIRLGIAHDDRREIAMDVAEIAVFDRSLTESERFEVEQYLAATYFGGAVNAPPAIAINSPADGAIHTEDDPVELAAAATDPEDGDVSAGITWSSDIDGEFGTGASVVHSFSVGDHTITASVTDSGGFSAIAEITLHVLPTPTGACCFGDDSCGEMTLAGCGAEGGAYQGNGTECEGGMCPQPISCALVTEGLVLHLESDAGVIAGVDDAVAEWRDQSAGANDLFAAGDPEFVTGATPTGMPALQLDGGDKLERCATDAIGSCDTVVGNALAGLPSGSADRTMFFVVRYDATPSYAGFAYGRGDANETFGLVVNGGGGRLTVHGWGRGNDQRSNTTGTGAGWLVQSAVVEDLGGGGDAGIWHYVADAFGSSLIDSDTHDFGTVLEKIVIGEESSGAGYFTGRVAAALVYDHALAEAEREQVEAYLLDKYIVDICEPAVGACCLADESCVELTSAACSSSNGLFQGDNTECSSGMCLLPTGACCLPDDNCVVVNELECAAVGGAYRGDDEACDPGLCLVPTGACCLADFTCSTLSEADCTSAGGAYQGDGEPCTPALCAPPIGACCHADGSCTEIPETACLATGGVYHGNDTACAPRLCPQPIGACCFVDGGCSSISEVDCAGSGGTYQGDDSSCAPGLCPQPASCVLVRDGLVLHLESDAGVIAGVDDSVLEWRDQSGVANDLFAVGNPTFVAGSTPTGLPALDLDGSDKLERCLTDSLGACDTSAGQALTGLPSGSADRTMFFVVRYDVTPSYAGFAYGRGKANETFGLVVGGGGGRLTVHGWGRGNDQRSNSTGTGAGWLVQSAVVEDLGGAGEAGFWHYVASAGGSSLIDSDTHDFATALEKIVIGEESSGAGFFTGQVAAALIYNRALSQIERNQVEAYLLDKYIVDICAPAIGACCMADESCTEGTSASCSASGGLYQGDSTECSPGMCMLPTGACCLPDDTCVLVNELECAAAGGAYRGDDVACEAGLCLVPAGACCLPDFTCSTVAEADCASAGGAYQGDDVPCTPTLCSPPSGACCYPDGACGESPEMACVATGGLYQGDGSACAPGLCPQPIGACCFVDGSCSGVTRDDCIATGGTYQGDDSVCEPGLCPQPASCVLVADGLVLHLESDAGVIAGVDDMVVEWQDQSIAANDLFAVGQPTFIAGSTPTGLPALRLGGNDKLERCATDTIGTCDTSTGRALVGLPSGSEDRTMFFVVRYDQTPSYAGFAYGRGAPNETFGLVVNGGGGRLTVHGWGRSNDQRSNTTGTGAGWLVQSAVVEGLGGGSEAGIWHYVADSGGSSLIDSDTHDFATGLEKIVIGEESSGAGYFTGEVAAALIYNRALTDTEREQVEAYLLDKYIFEICGPARP